MTTVSQPAYFNLQAFTDLGALGVGYRLYTYVQGTNTQKTAYTDSAGTIAHTYTSDGGGGEYIAMNARGELPAPLYLTAGAYDLALKTSAGATVWTRRADPVWSFLSEGAGSVSTSLQEKVSRYADVFDTFTAAQITDVTGRTGAVDVSAPVNAALLAASTRGQKSIRFPAGKYFCGSHSTADIIFDLSTYGDDFTIICDGLVEFVCTTTASVVPVFFQIQNNNRFTQIGTIRFRDTGYDNTITNKGAAGFVIKNTGTAYQDISLGVISSKNVTASVIVQGKYTTRTKNINISAIYSDDCYYGVNCQDQGDSVKVGAIYAYRNYRPVFIYGISGFEATVYNYHNRATSGAINVSRSVGGYNTEAVKVRYVARDMADPSTHVLLNHIDTLGGTISNVSLDLDIESSIAYNPVEMLNYDGAGASTSGASSNVVKDVVVSGAVDSNALGISSTGTWSTATGQISIHEATYLVAATNLASKMDIRLLNDARVMKDFTPVVIGASAAGTGTYTADRQKGRAKKIGRTVHFTLMVVWTAHTGTGNTEIGELPYTSENITGHLFPVTIIQSGGPVPGSGQQRVAYIAANSTRIVLRELNPATNAISNSNAVTAAGSIWISGSYPTA
jgi:hypothetical protein